MKLKQITAAIMVLGLSSMAFAVDSFTIKDIRVEGLQRTRPATVFSYLPIKVGDQFNDTQGSEIIKRLYSTGFFDDIRVESMDNQVLLTVVERPIISSINITGSKTIDSDAIKKNLSAFGLGLSRPFNQTTLNQSLAGLRDAFHDRGKNNVVITPKITHLERNRVAIDLKINEGITTTIKHINFSGNKHFSSHNLRNQMQLSENGLFTWLSKSNRFAEDKFRQDLDNITLYYQDKGYYDFHVTDVDVKMSDDHKSQTINIAVDEGQRYRWGDITIQGNSEEVPIDQLQKLLTMKKGRWYNRSQMVDSLKLIQDKMGSAGYAFNQVDVQPQPNAETGVVNFTLTVIPNRKVYVHNINITGNNKTRDEVLRREFRQMESAPYDLSKIERSQERIQQLGYFDNVKVDTTPIQNTPDQVDLNMSVKERSTGTIQASAGWAQDDGLLMSAGISQDNLFGSGKSASVSVSRSKVTTGASLSFTDPYFTPDGISLGYDIYGENYRPDKSSTNKLGYKQTKIGLGARLGVPITEYDRVNFGLGVEHLDSNLLDNPPIRYQNFVNQNGKKNWILKGSAGWGRNKTDSALWPTRGYIMNANLDSGLPGGDLLYYNLSHDQRWYFPLNKTFTLMFSGEIAYANHYGKTKELPFFQSLYGGGLGSVRGYETDTLGPKYFNRYNDGTYSSDASSFGGKYKTNFNAELLFPFPGVKDQHTVRLSLFADAGSVWDGKKYTYDNDKNPYRSREHHSTFNNEFRYSAGVAVTWLSPLGLVKLSYANPFKKKPEDQIQRFQFQLGTAF